MPFNSDSPQILERRPTVEGTRRSRPPSDSNRIRPKPIEIGLANSLFTHAPLVNDRAIGMGRIVGDGALAFYLTGIMVHS
jgi:hypothetical protein